MIQLLFYMKHLVLLVLLLVVTDEVLEEVSRNCLVKEWSSIKSWKCKLVINNNWKKFILHNSGVYLCSVIYSDEGRVLVTMDDQLPIVEVSDSHASSIGTDFAWLAKVCCINIYNNIITTLSSLCIGCLYLGECTRYVWLVWELYFISSYSI